MKFLANENFPYPSIRFLRDKGFDVVSICEKFGGISDETVMQMAVNERLTILTFDRDYGELIFKFQKDDPPDVIYFRVKGENPAFAGTKLWDLMQNENLIIEGYFTVIEKNGIRQRKLRKV